MKTTKYGTFWVESESFAATTCEGVYAGGDDFRGADLVVTAVAAGRLAAYAMDAWLRHHSARTPL